MKIEISESFTVTSGRLHEIISLYMSIGAKNQQSWCKLFNTKSYQKSLLTIKKLKRRIEREVNIIVNDNHLSWDRYDIFLAGSKNLYDVRARLNQSYRISKR